MTWSDQWWNVGKWNNSCVKPWKSTWQWRIIIFRYEIYLHSWSFFHCHVSFHGSSFFSWGVFLSFGRNAEVFAFFLGEKSPRKCWHEDFEICGRWIKLEKIPLGTSLGNGSKPLQRGARPSWVLVGPLPNSHAWQKTWGWSVILLTKWEAS